MINASVAVSIQTPPQHWNGTAEVIVGCILSNWLPASCTVRIIRSRCSLWLRGSRDFAETIAHQIPCSWVRLRLDFIISTRAFSASFYKGRLSAKLQLLFGVPQGSVLGPILFLLYTAELIDIIVECGLVVHAYADDTEKYESETILPLRWKVPEEIKKYRK